MTQHIDILTETETASAPPLPALTSRIDDIVAARDAALAKAQEAASALDRAFDLSQDAAALARVARCGRSFGGIDRTGSKHYTALFRDDSISAGW